MNPTFQAKTVFVINKAIAEWIRKERSGYFRRHNIESFDAVPEIREKTILSYFLILGRYAVNYPHVYY